MSQLLVRFLYSAAISVLFVTTTVGVTLAASSDYRFEVMKPPEATGSGRGSSVTVTLVYAPTGKRVTDADVFRRETVFREKGPVRFDERHTPLAPDGQGNYRLVTSYPLGSGTTLQLGAIVPSESGIVRRSVRLDSSR
jgi:hypothetical protein